MTNYIYSLFLLLGIILLFSCSRNNQKEVNKKSVENPILKVENYAKTNHTENCIITYNKTKEYVLISNFKKIRPSDLNPTVKFEILKVSSLESLFSDAVPQGEVGWEDEYVVKVYSNQGIPDPNGKVTNRTYRYHAKNRKKYSGGFLNNKN